jgi:predicted dienelactone hydrolase
MAAVASTGAAHGEPFEAGFLQLTLSDPVEGGPMAAVVVFPTTAPTGPTQLGPITIVARRAAPPAPGSYPLVVVSHGTGGSSLTHHDSLTTLARAGFVAVAVEHPRDNFRDDSGFGTDLQLIGRSHHIVAIIDAVLAHPVIGPLVDRARGVGMVGHSAGGYTALLTAGGVPNFSLQADYHRAVPDDPMRRRANAAGSLRGSNSGLPLKSDDRVRAIVLMAPALGYVFDRAALASVHIPVLLYRPSADEVLPHPWNAQRIAEMLPSPPEYHVVPGAGHFIFLAPCSSAFAALVPSVCTDPAGIDRAAFHQRLNSEIIEFFRRNLVPPK